MTTEDAVNSDSAPEPEEVVVDVNNESSPSPDQTDVNEQSSSSEPTKEEQTIPFSRFNEVNLKRREAERAFNDVKVKLADYEAQNNKLSSDEPTLEGFNYDEDLYQDAVVNYRVTKEISNRDAVIQQSKLEQEAATRLDGFNNKAAQYENDHADYIKAKQNFGNNMIDDDLANAIVASDNAPAIHHALLNNLDLMNKLENMDVISMNRELGRIEASLINKTKTKKQTSAPEAINLDSSGSSGSTMPNYEQMSKMTAEQYRKMREG